MAKILIVDDDADILHALYLIFSSRGYEVLTTLNGEETFNLAINFQPALLCLDINLGSLDGRDISRLLKNTEETKHISIILLSANVIRGTTFKDSLADEFLSKPFDIHLLMVIVNKLLGSEDDAESLSA